MAIKQATKQYKEVFIMERVATAGGHIRETYRRLPWKYVRYDEDLPEWDVEPYNDGPFVSEGDGAQPVIQQRLSDRGTCVGFEMIDRGVMASSSLQEFFQCTSFSDGSQDVVSPVD